MFQIFKLKKGHFFAVTNYAHDSIGTITFITILRIIKIKKHANCSVSGAWILSNNWTIFVQNANLVTFTQFYDTKLQCRKVPLRWIYDTLFLLMLEVEGRKLVRSHRRACPKNWKCVLSQNFVHISKSTNVSFRWRYGPVHKIGETGAGLTRGRFDHRWYLEI